MTRILQFPNSVPRMKYRAEGMTTKILELKSKGEKQQMNVPFEFHAKVVGLAVPEKPGYVLPTKDQIIAAMNAGIAAAGYNGITVS
jgi:hypothetical protein